MRHAPRRWSPGLVIATGITLLMLFHAGGCTNGTPGSESASPKGAEPEDPATTSPLSGEAGPDAGDAEGAASADVTGAADIAPLQEPGTDASTPLNGDTSGTIDALEEPAPTDSASPGDTKGPDGDVEGGGPFIESCGEVTPLTALQEPSSKKACLCWPKGDDCMAVGLIEDPPVPEMACPENEACLGGPNWNGMCYKLCECPGLPGNAGKHCSEGEECRPGKIKHVEGTVVADFGFCGPPVNKEPGQDLDSKP